MAGKQYKMYIYGEWVEALDKEYYDDLNPYTGEVFAKVPSGKRPDVRRAIDAAAAAFPSWSHTLPAKRQALFLKAAEILERKRDEIVSILADETGCTFGFAMFQTMFTPGLLRGPRLRFTKLLGRLSLQISREPSIWQSVNL